MKWGGGSMVWWGAANGGLIGFNVKDDNLNMPNIFMHFKKCPRVSPLYPTMAFVPMQQLDDVACYPGYAAHFPSALGKLQSTERSFFSPTVKWITISLSFRLLARVYVYHIDLKALWELYKHVFVVRTDP